MHSDISRQEIQKCWKLHIPYLYKDKQRIRKNNRFIRANSDGSEDIVELIDQKQAIYSRDIHFRKIKTSKDKKRKSISALFSLTFNFLYKFLRRQNL